MKREIESILKGVPGVKVDQVEQLWRIRILGGRRTGARVNGVSLARDMLKKYSREIEEAKALEAKPATPPATDYDAIIASLKAQLAEAQAKTAFAPHAEPVEVAMPEFLKTPPHDVADTLQELGLHSSDSYERVNTALVAKLTEAKGSAELARTYGGAFNGKSVVEWERKSQSINESIRWNSGRKVEVI